MENERDAVAENLVRKESDALNEILGKKFPVLDDGHIRVIEYMGNEDTIVQAARVSYGKGTKKSSQDKALIKYLLRHRHTTPFEMCEIMLHVRVPMDCWRQWIRHRTANVNEYSTRYSEAIDDKQKTPPEQWRSQSADNKQGSSGFLELEKGEVLSLREEELQNQATHIYHERLRLGVAREQARKDLPLSTYTESYWKIDLHNLLHFLSLRMDSHSQWEIRQYANAIGNEVVSRWLPTVWESFQEQAGGLFLGSSECQIISSIIRGDKKWISIGIKQKWLDEDGNATKKSRVRDEIGEKLAKLKIEVPW